MRSFVGFLAMVATGLFAAVVLAMSLQASGARVGSGVPAGSLGGLQLDYVSLLLGLFLGLMLATLSRISWSNIPRRFAAWLIRNEANFLRLGLAFCFLAIIVLY